MKWGDVLYGEIDIPPEIQRLFRHPELVRSRGISLDVLPAEVVPFSSAANRFQHGIGVWHLAQHLSAARPEFQHLEPNLSLAGLLHDVWSAPFSHIGDWFMRAQTGDDGETRPAEALKRSELSVEIKELGGDPELICRLIAGTAKPWSDLIAGSLDLDNIDNLARYSRTRGIRWFQGYVPEELAAAFRLSPTGDAIQLDSQARAAVDAWRRVRLETYKHVYVEPHLTFSMMLYRALELAHAGKELSGRFWNFTDNEALDYLVQTCNTGTQTLARAVRGLQPYHAALRIEIRREMPFDWDWDAWRIRYSIANEIAEELGLERHEVAVYIGPNNGERIVAIRYSDDAGVSESPAPLTPRLWRFAVFLRRETNLSRVLFSDPEVLLKRVVESQRPWPQRPAIIGRAGF